eukprot:13178411-Alexandrium_andersonii.AAC.1
MTSTSRCLTQPSPSLDVQHHTLKPTPWPTTAPLPHCTAEPYFAAHLQRTHAAVAPDHNQRQSSLEPPSHLHF